MDCECDRAEIAARVSAPIHSAGNRPKEEEL